MSCNVNKTNNDINFVNYYFNKNNNGTIESIESGENITIRNGNDVTKISNVGGFGDYSNIYRFGLNNHRSSDLRDNEKCLDPINYRDLGVIMGVDSSLLPNILNYPSTHVHCLKSLTPDDFEKIKHAFHKYLPTYQDLDKIDLAPLKFKYRDTIRYDISSEMREIIRIGVDRIIDNESAKKSQEGSARKTKQEAVETLTATSKNSDQNEPQPKKVKTMPSTTHQQPVSIQNEVAVPQYRSFFLEEIIGPWRRDV